MNCQFLLNLLALMQIIELSENSHVQLAKQRIKTEVNASIVRLPSPSPSTDLSAVTSSSAHPFYHHDHHHEHTNRNNRFAPPQHHDSYRNDQRRHYRLDHRHHHRHNRWVPRRHHHHHHQWHLQYSPWTAWSPCSPECIQRRERYCKTKRKCGHIKHIEERKCWRCQPAWPTKSSSLPPHAVEQQQQQQQQQQQHQINSAPPTIVINAAAAAATAPVSATSAITQPESHLQHRPHEEKQQPTPKNILPTELNNIHQPVTIHPHAKDQNYHHSSSLHHFKDDTSNHYNDDHSAETDFYVVRSKRKRKQQHKRKPQLNEFEDYSVEYDEDDHGLTQEDDNLRDLGLSTSTEFLEPSSGEVRTIRNQKFLQPSISLVHSKRQEQRQRKRLRDHHKGRRNSRRKLKGAIGIYDDGAIEGDVFQYEDFDMDVTRAENQYSDVSYEDDDNGNSSNFSRSKEKATPEHLIPKHRRIYSKWSRWTKCSPKCTTRRYKKCRVREQCGREVLREIAYCYTEGSFCQQWLQAQVQKSSSYDLKPVATRRREISDDGGTLSNSIGGTLGDFIMNGKGYRGPEYTPMKLKCGIAPIRNNKRNMYNMLKIIGGKAARKGEWPWQVAIFNRYKEAFCGGTLIAPQWVLTAAHCVRKVLYVRIGEHNLDYEDGTELQVKVLKSFKHPNFDKKTVDSDVALLKLPKPINSTTWIGFSCLPRPYQPLPKNLDCTVIGWGKRRNRDVAGTSVLHQAEVPIIPMDNCRSVYHDYTITKNMFCAGHKRGRIDTCAGDSGGPLLCRDTTKPNHPWTIFGITSFGDGCAKRNKFGIYAKVPNYVDWVWSVINCNGNCKMHQRSA